MRTQWMAVALAAALTGTACDSITTPDFDELGVVQLVEIEGGCWVIETETEILLPINLPEEYRVDGLVVTFEAERAPDVVTFCMLGIPVEILRIRQADD
jgi:hypothetical protein